MLQTVMSWPAQVAGQEGAPYARGAPTADDIIRNVEEVRLACGHK